MKRAVFLLGGLGSAFSVALSGEVASDCPCPEVGVASQHSLLVTSLSLLDQTSRLDVRQDQPGSGGLSATELKARFGQAQKEHPRLSLLQAAHSSLACLDDRLEEPSLTAPGGELGEFTTALAAYLQEKDGLSGSHPNQEVVDSLLAKYVETVPSTRPIVFCTDERALQRIAAELPTANLDLNAPSEHLQAAGLLDKLTEPASQGDSHFRLLLEDPVRYELHPQLGPMVLRAFFQLLWAQNQDRHKSPKLQLRVLRGEPDPQAFVEVSCNGACGDAVAALVPSAGPVLASQLAAPLPRRRGLAAFFARASRSTPRKVSEQSLLARIDQLALLALESTGSRIAAGLPFFTLTYSP